MVYKCVLISGPCLGSSLSGVLCVRWVWYQIRVQAKPMSSVCNLQWTCIRCDMITVNKGDKAKTEAGWGGLVKIWKMEGGSQYRGGSSCNRGY